MITIHSINETLAGEMTDSMKIDFLEHIQNRLFELFDRWEITETDHDYLMDYTTNKAKEILGILNHK